MSDWTLEEHVRRFNEGVRTGDFAPLVELFADDGELAFEGVPVGPFAGRESIAAAYAARPPDDELRVLGSRRDGDTLVAGYSWLRDGGRRSGELRVTVRDGRIARLVVAFA